MDTKTRDCNVRMPGYIKMAYVEIFLEILGTFIASFSPV